nr:basic proline-rich protein-like [Aegilops tauschii subsp. strangulata]
MTGRSGSASQPSRRLRLLHDQRRLAHSAGAPPRATTRPAGSAPALSANPDGGLGRLRPLHKQRRLAHSAGSPLPAGVRPRTQPPPRAGSACSLPRASGSSPQARSRPASPAPNRRVTGAPASGFIPLRPARRAPVAASLQLAPPADLPHLGRADSPSARATPALPRGPLPGQCAHASAPPGRRARLWPPPPPAHGRLLASAGSRSRRARLRPPPPPPMADFGPAPAPAAPGPAGSGLLPRPVADPRSPVVRPGRLPAPAF